MMFHACVGICVIFQLEWTLLFFGCCLLSDGNMQGTLRGSSNMSSLLLLTFALFISFLQFQEGKPECFSRFFHLFLPHPLGT